MSQRRGYGSRHAVAAVADCAPPPVRGGTAAYLSRAAGLGPLKPCESPLDSGFMSGHLSPTSPPVLFHYQKDSPADCRQAEQEVSAQLSGLQLEERRLDHDAEEDAACERHYVATLEEAFKGDENGDTHLHLAIIYGYSRVADCLIRLVPHPDFLNLRNSYMQTPLHLAALTGQAALCRRLLVAGADAGRRDRHGNTPLHLACERADRQSVLALTASVAAAESRQAELRYSGPAGPAPLPLDEWNYQGLSCLHLAVLSGDLQLVAHLVAHGADVACMEGKSGRTPLHLAVEAGNMPLLRLLTDMCGADVHATTYGGLSSYQLALLNARLDVAETLEGLGAVRDPLPDSDMEASDSESEMFLKPEEFLSDVRIGGRPLVAA